LKELALLATPLVAPIAGTGTGSPIETSTKSKAEGEGYWDGVEVIDSAATGDVELNFRRQGLMVF
jgi:hypothetical protein